MNKISSCLFFKLVLIFSLVGVNQQTRTDNGSNGLIIAGGLLVGTGVAYVTGRASSALCYYFAKRCYEPEMELLQRMAYKESVLEEELVPYILEQHAQANEAFFYNPGEYKNYPLIHYKKNLDRYINNLWYLQLFRLGTEMRREISTFIDKLKMIRRYIVTDYRYIKEQRQFDERS